MSKLLYTAFVVMALLGADFTFAQTQLTYTPLEPLPGVDYSGTNFSKFLQGFFTLLFTVGGAIAVGTLVFAGITYMVSEVVDKKSEARRRIQAAFWGLLLLIAAWLILYTINPKLLEFNFSPTPVTVQGVIPPSPGSNLSGGNNSDPQQLTPKQWSLAQGYAVTQVLGCSFYNIACTSSTEYITYFPQFANSDNVRAAISAYTLSCAGKVGKVTTIDGEVVGAPGQTALVCAGPGAYLLP